MSLAALRALDYNAVMARLMRRQNISAMIRGVRVTSRVVVVAAALITGAIIASEITSNFSLSTDLDERISSLTSQAAASKPSAITSDKNWDLLLERRPFGTLGKITPNTPTQAAPPPSPLMLSLIGTFITQGQEPYAIIEDKKKQSQEMFLIDQSVFDQAVLKKIMKDRVEVERNGKLETLMLDELGGGGGEESVSAESDEFVVSEAELDKGLENLPLLLTQARAVPYFKDGRSIGLRLFAIKTGSLYEKVGLKNGDILKSINGNSLGDISQALKLFEQLKQERSINLVLERDKQDREFKYSIR